MRNLFHRILKTLNINGRDWVVLLLALLLAFSIWIIHNLSLKYSDYVSVSVSAHCSIQGYSEISAGDSEVTARCRATGYKMLRLFIREGRSVDVTFRPSDMKHKTGDIFYMTAGDLKDYAHMIFGQDVTVEYFVTDTLFFRFPYENFKKVPVLPISAITYRNQYMADGHLEVSPDSILVYGEPMRIENVNAVYTRPVNYMDLAKDISGVVRLEKIKGVRFSVPEVRYDMSVRRFVEITRSVPVSVVNVPEGKNMLVYPSVVDVSLKCSFPLVDDPERGLRIEADYNDMQQSLGGRCVLKVASLSRGVIGYEIIPVSVSCIIEDR